MDIEFGHLVGFPYIIHIDICFTFQFNAKYIKIALVFQLRQAVLNTY